MRFEQFPLTTARTNWNSWMENQIRTQLKQTFVHKKLFFHGCLSVTDFKKASDKNWFAFNTLIIASRKQFTALRKHYFQCRLTDQNLIPAKQGDLSTFYTKARGQQSSCTCLIVASRKQSVVTCQHLSFNTESDQNLIPAKQGDLFVFYTKNQKSIILIYFFKNYE